MPHRTIQDIEKAFNISSLETGRGIPIWPMLKDKIYFELLRNKFHYSSDKRTRNKIQLLKNTLYGLRSLVRFPYYKYYFFQNTNKRLLWNSKFFDPYFDAWADKVGQDSSVFVEFATSNYFRSSDVHSKNIVSDLPFYLMAKMISIFIFPKIKKKEVLDEILSSNGIQLGYSRVLREKLGTYYLYKFLFRVSKPRAIFVLSSFSKIPLVLAAKKLGITVYEAQHGYIGDSHPFYNTQIKFPQAYPDYLFSFGKYERENSNNLIFSRENIIPTGSFELETRNSKPIPEPLQRLNNDFVSIYCITLQTIKEPELLGCILPFARDNRNHLFIICPKDLSKEYDRYLEQENLMLFPEYSVYDILKISDYNITIFSTTAVEAEYFGVKVIFYNASELSRKYYPIEKMNAIVLEENEYLNEEALRSFSSRKSQKYFCKDYLSNVENTTLQI
ncbi:MAG: hypothetical protein KJP26_04330 [Maribacter sp.]|nr:hypothetical protein [Maribacter sp.]